MPNTPASGCLASDPHNPSRPVTRPVAGFVLAGGQSRRMGRNKALLEIAGETLLVRTARLVFDVTGSTIVIGDPDLYIHCGFPVIGDRISGMGPLGGLLTALENTTAEWNLVVACDMPGLTANALRELLAAAENAGSRRCVVPVTNDLPQPLCALYHRDCLPVVGRAVAAGHLRMQDLVKQIDSVPAFGFDPQVFENVNTWREWLAYGECS